MPSLLDFHSVGYLLGFFALMINPNMTFVLYSIVWSGVYEKCVRKSVVKDGEKALCSGCSLWNDQPALSKVTHVEQCCFVFSFYLFVFFLLDMPND